MEISNVVLALLLGTGLAASTGLNTFLPLLLLSGAARFGIAGIELNGKFAWITSDVAIIVLIVACVIELVADKIPALDHLLDGAATFLRPAAGLVAMASVLTDFDPVTAAVVGLIVGSPISFGFHSLKAATRVASTATTFGCANPAISVVEDIASAGLSLVAIFAPVLVPLLLILFVAILWRVASRLRTAGPAAADSAP